MSFAHRSVRRRQAEVCGLLLLMGWAGVACTSLLDIDGEYTLQTETGGTASRGSSGGGAGGAFAGLGGSWQESSGGRALDAGSGSGGTLVVASGGISAAIGGGGGFGAEPGTGGVPPQTGGVSSNTGGILDIPDAATPDCATGYFEGTFEGMHAPSITFVGVPLPVDGRVTFQLVEGGTPNKLKVAEALFRGEFNIIPNAQGVPFTATMVGDYDCRTRELSGELVNGGFTNPESMATAPIGFSGSFSARFGTQFTGTWQEAEDLQQYKGNGSFTARRVVR